MAGRPRIHTDAAQRTPAYRKRIEEQDRGTIKVYGEWYERNQADITGLKAAVWTAQHRNDPLALSLRTQATEDLIADLTRFFETGEVTPTPAPQAKR